MLRYKPDLELRALDSNPYLAPIPIYKGMVESRDGEYMKAAEVEKLLKGAADALGPVIDELALWSENTDDSYRPVLRAAGGSRGEARFTIGDLRRLARLKYTMNKVI